MRSIDEDDLTHRDRVLSPILRRLARARPPEAGPGPLALWEVVIGEPKVSAYTNRLEGWFGRVKPQTRLTRGLQTEAGTLNFVRLMARSMV
ncbi:MAG: hypothetical protein F4Y80_17005 [Caldilineaceae bacterium SB0665_bin_21]|nr:hypothetical protein [Caldilineaceae bacterium SB0665_bin_21]MYA06294.1 hypothetical protein [Caldilineaceae bacterium SB0664_bin_22]MYC64403.1 hypothetical protein [Caldilineaceae bacterium SB0661_bin_34]